MGTMWGKREQDDIISKGKFVHLSCLVRLVPIRYQYNWFPKGISLLSKWDKGLFKPLVTDVIICPAISGLCKTKTLVNKGNEQIDETHLLRPSTEIQSPVSPGGIIIHRGQGTP